MSYLEHEHNLLATAGRNPSDAQGYGDPEAIMGEGHMFKHAYGFSCGHGSKDGGGHGVGERSCHTGLIGDGLGAGQASSCDHRDYHEVSGR